MLLAVDVGNTNTNFAVIDNGEFKVFFAITTKLPRTSDEFSAAIREQLWINRLPVECIDGCIVASVVPGIMHSLVNGIIKVTGIRPMEVGAGTKTGIKIRLANTKEAGADTLPAPAVCRCGFFAPGDRRFASEAAPTPAAWQNCRTIRCRQSDTCAKSIE